MTPPSILIVDDEEDLASTLAFNLEREGWSTMVAHDGRTALEMALGTPKPDLILLDLMLPDMSGTDICREIRANEATHETPIVMVTAKDDEIDRVVGFEVGADDYVAKPFSTRELMLRIKAILRRLEPPATQQPECVQFGIIEIDRAAYRVWVGKEELSLTALEFKLLTTLMERRGRVQSRDTLLIDVWGHSPGLPTRTVDTHVQRLRRKLNGAADYIETLRGVGYRFRSGPLPQTAAG